MASCAPLRFTVQDFLALVFDAGEATCFSPDIKGTRISAAHAPPLGSLFFSINPMHATKDTRPTESYHCSTKPRRADLNCTAYRAILCEFDRISLDEQLAFIENCGLPYSSLTYSGGKSIHVLIVLDQPVERETYDSLVRRIFKALGHEVDPANKNPSRLSRMPGGVRENGNTQDLIEVRSRVQLKVLEQWLDNRGIIERAAYPEQASFEGIFNQRVESARMSTSSKQFLSGHYVEGTWNITLFKAACELFKLGSSWNEVVDSCSKITGYLDQRDLATLRSAQKTIESSRRNAQSRHHLK